MHALAAPPADDGIVGWAVNLMATLGAPGAGLVLAVENVSPPIPSELVLPLVGFAVGRGEFTAAAAIVWTTIGATVGAIVLYLVGRLARPETVRRWLTCVPLVGDREVDLAEAWFDRHGRAAVFLGRMVPGVRSFVSLPAGQRRMPFGEFVLLTAAGSAIWNTAFIAVGYALGSRWHVVERYSGVGHVVVPAAAGVIVLLLVGVRIEGRRRRRPVTSLAGGTRADSG